MYGKWILRKAFADYLPDKYFMAAESPAGSRDRHYDFARVYDGLISDGEFAQKTSGDFLSG